MHILIPVSIVLGDRTYRVKIQPEDEEVVRKTVKTINDKILEFKTQFAGKDMQDYIAMVLIWFATEQPPASDVTDLEGIKKMLEGLEKTMDEELG